MTADLKVSPGAILRRNDGFQRRHGLPSIPDFSGVRVANGKSREDTFYAEDINKWEKHGGCLMALHGQILKAQEEVEREIDEVGSLSASYIAAVKKIRGELGNDVDSIAKASARLKVETAKAIDEYRAALTLWTSPEMERAISNAERLATALKSVNELKSQSITFAVLDKKTGA